MKKSLRFRLILPFVAALALASCVSGPYVDPGNTNPGLPGSYTRSESRAAVQRLVDSMLADPGFAALHAAKSAQRGGTAPVIQVAYIENVSTERNGSHLAALRNDLSNALTVSRRFVVSGDIDACDYVLRGEYRSLSDPGRVGHVLTLVLVDLASDAVVWSGSDEIAKRPY